MSPGTCVRVVSPLSICVQSESNDSAITLAIVPLQVYYAYSIIYKNALSPFKSVHPVTLFNCARFLLMRTLNRPAPLGVSMVQVVYTLARHAMELGAYKLARFAYNKLQVSGRVCAARLSDCLFCSDFDFLFESGIGPVVPLGGSRLACGALNTRVAWRPRSLV